MNDHHTDDEPAARADPHSDDGALARARAHIAAITERERRLRLALLASDDEIWEYAIADDRIAFEHEITGTTTPAPPATGDAATGASVARGTVSLAEFIASTHPEHRQPLQTALATLRRGEAEFTEVTIRRQRRDGGWVWLHLRGRIADRDAAGKPSLIVGSARDITHMRHNADRLRLALNAAGEELWEFDIVHDRNRRENALDPRHDADYERLPATEVFTGLCHPDDIARIHKIYVDLRWGRAREFHAVYRMRGADGSWRWMDAHGRGVDLDDHGLPTRIIGTNRDITDLKQGEARLRTVLWGSGAELWDIDLTTATIHRSHPIPGLKLNARGEAIAFADLMAAVPAEHAASIRAGMVAQVKGLSEKFEVWFRLEADDGSWRWLYSHGKVSERDANGRALRMAGTLHDVSAMKKIEDELRVLNEQLEQRVADRTAALTLANTELSRTIERLDETRAQLVESEKMASLGSLVAGVSHEINTPLGVGITGTSHLLEELDAIERELATGTLDPKLLAEHASLMRECGELVQRSLLRADKLVRSFKQVAVTQSVETPRPLRLAEAIDGAVLPLAERFADGGHAIAIDCPPAIELSSYGNALQQVLTALLANALEHAVVPPRPLRLTIAAVDAGDAVAIDFRDDGAGMARDVRMRIFDPFFTTRRGHGSLGLGMHIVYNLVTQRLRGRIACISEPGAGTQFNIRLPKQVGDADD